MVILPSLTAVFRKVGVAVVDVVGAEDTGEALGTVDANVEDTNEILVDWTCDVVLGVEEDEEEEEETATVDKVLLLLVVAADDEVVAMLEVEGVVIVVRVVKLGDKVVCRIVVCKMVVVTGCRQTAPIPLPARNFPMSSVVGAVTPVHSVWSNTVSACKPLMHACEHPR